MDWPSAIIVLSTMLAAQHALALSIILTRWRFPAAYCFLRARQYYKREVRRYRYSWATSNRRGKFGIVSVLAAVAFVIVAGAWDTAFPNTAGLELASTIAGLAFLWLLVLAGVAGIYWFAGKVKSRNREPDGGSRNEA